MTKETIDWYTPDEQQPPFAPGTGLIGVLANGMFVSDLKWMGNGFIAPDRNSMQWMEVPPQNIKLWAAFPTGGDNLIMLPSPNSVNHQTKIRRLN